MLLARITKRIPGHIQINNDQISNYLVVFCREDTKTRRKRRRFFFATKTLRRKEKQEEDFLVKKKITHIISPYLFLVPLCLCGSDCFATKTQRREEKEEDFFLPLRHKDTKKKKKKIS